METTSDIDFLFGVVFILIPLAIFFCMIGMISFFFGRHSKRAFMSHKYKDILKMKAKAPQITLSEGQTFEIKKHWFIEKINQWS